MTPPKPKPPTKRRATNVCEHGDHRAPAGVRFCSKACRVCEAGGAPCSDECVRLNLDNAIEELIGCGARMSNLCFNLKQRSAYPEDERATMAMEQALWDRALRDFRALPTPHPKTSKRNRR